MMMFLRRDSFFVINSSCTCDVSSWCCFVVKLLLTWCMPLFLCSHCLCVILIKLLISWAPNESTEPPGLYCRSIDFIASIRMYGILPSIMQSHPKLLIVMAIGIKHDCSQEQSSIVHWPWLERYASIILHNLGMTFALSRTSMTVSIDWRSCRRWPGSMHCVRCFEFSFLHPHCGHLFTMFFSRSDNFELQTAPARDLRSYKCVECLGVSCHCLFVSIPPDQIKVCCKYYFLFIKKIATLQPQKSSSSNLGSATIFFPPISLHTCSFEKVLSINLPVLIAAFSGFLASPSTLIFICSFSIQSCHLFVSSAWAWTYLYLKEKGCAKPMAYFEVNE